MRKVADDETAYFGLMIAVMATAAVLAGVVHLPGIVEAFLAGLAVNAAVHEKPAKEKLQFLGDALFISIFFVATGFLIEPHEFYSSIINSFLLHWRSLLHCSPESRSRRKSPVGHSVTQIALG